MVDLFSLCPLQLFLPFSILQNLSIKFSGWFGISGTNIVTGFIPQLLGRMTKL